MHSVTVIAPGRINLIGEHTDYNNGFVLPAAIQYAACVTISKREDNQVHLKAIDLNESLVIDALAVLQKTEIQWANYIIGVIVQIAKNHPITTGFNLEIKSNVPIGAGLSSSAAIECAVAFGINELFALGIEKMELALMAQKAEHDFAGVQCGIMDQFASVFGKKDHVVLLDCQSMDYQYFPLNLAGYQIVLFDTGVKHALANSEYNTRRQECEAGVQMIQSKYPAVKSLRDAIIQMLNETVDAQNHQLIYNRCKYVIEEIERTYAATADLKANQLKAFGEKMYATHKGLSELFQVSCHELDVLINAVIDNPNVIGARMMGGGFGGCTINIVKENQVQEIISSVAQQYLAQTGKALTHYTVTVQDGVRLI